MGKEKKIVHPVEYNYLYKHNPYYVSKLLSLKNLFKGLHTISDDVIYIEFDDIYTDSEKLRDDIVAYIRNEKHLFCEAIDYNHFLIDGKRYILNVGFGEGQTTTLYREDI